MQSGVQILNQGTKRIECKITRRVLEKQLVTISHGGVLWQLEHLETGTPNNQVYTIQITRQDGPCIPTEFHIHRFDTSSTYYHEFAQNQTKYYFSVFRNSMNIDFKFKKGTNLSDSIKMDLQLVDPVKTMHGVMVDGVAGPRVVLGVGGKRIGIPKEMWPLTEQLEKLVDASSEIQLHGVDYDDLRTLLDNPDLIDVVITVDKCRNFAEIERRYGIKHHSELVTKIQAFDFLAITNNMPTKLMSNESERIEFDEYTPIVVNYPNEMGTQEMKYGKKFKISKDRFPFVSSLFVEDFTFSFFFYTQSYNSTNYLSIGIGAYKKGLHTTELWRRIVGFEVKLHHRTIPELNYHTEIIREFNNFDLSAGCPTFISTKDLSDYIHPDGSIVISVAFNRDCEIWESCDISYPGVKDVTLISGGKKIITSRDLLAHYCGYFKDVFKVEMQKDEVSAALFPFDALEILIDLIYHRSKYFTFRPLRKVLNVADTLMCPYVHSYCDKLISNHYRVGVLSIHRVQELMELWDLHEFTEAQKMQKPNVQFEDKSEEGPSRKISRLDNFRF